MAGDKKKPTGASARLKTKSKSANVSEISEDSSSSAFDEDESFNSSKELEHAFNKINSKNKKDDIIPSSSSTKEVQSKSYGESPLSARAKSAGDEAQGTNIQSMDTFQAVSTIQAVGTINNLRTSDGVNGQSNVQISGSTNPHANVGSQAKPDGNAALGTSVHGNNNSLLEVANQNINLGGSGYPHVNVGSQQLPTHSDFNAWNISSSAMNHAPMSSNSTFGAFQPSHGFQQPHADQVSNFIQIGQQSNQLQQLHADPTIISYQIGPHSTHLQQPHADLAIMHAGPFTPFSQTLQNNSGGERNFYGGLHHFRGDQHAQFVQTFDNGGQQRRVGPVFPLEKSPHFSQGHAISRADAITPTHVGSHCNFGHVQRPSGGPINQTNVGQLSTVGTHVSNSISIGEPAHNSLVDTTQNRNFISNTFDQVSATQIGRFGQQRPQPPATHSHNLSTNYSDQFPALHSRFTQKSQNGFPPPIPPPKNSETNQNNHKKKFRKQYPLPQASVTSNWRDMFMSSIPEPCKMKYYEPVIRNGQPACSAPNEVHEIGNQYWEGCLLGQFLDKPPPFFLISNFVNNIWKKFGQVEVRSTDNGLYVFSFENPDVIPKVLGQLWHVNNRTLLLRKWDPNARRVEFKCDKVPIWVKLRNVPFSLWSVEGLSHVASTLGRPLQMDPLTATRAHLGYAHVCVEINLENELHNIIDCQDQNGDWVDVPVEYAWKPSRCSHCNIIGHRSSDCPSTKSINVNVEPVQQKVQLLSSPVVNVDPFPCSPAVNVEPVQQMVQLPSSPAVNLEPVQQADQSITEINTNNWTDVTRKKSVGKEKTHLVATPSSPNIGASSPKKGVSSPKSGASSPKSLGANIKVSTTANKYGALADADIDEADRESGEIPEEEEEKQSGFIPTVAVPSSGNLPDDQAGPTTWSTQASFP